MPPKSLLCRISIAFLIGGGIGNMIDRVLLGFVIDFIDFCAFPKIWMWVFNVADAFVTVGTIALMLYLVREIVLETVAERKARHEGENGVERESNEDA
jgi:signal peptidase II